MTCIINIYIYIQRDASCVTKEIRFTRKSVLLLQAADWRCVWKLSKMDSPLEKVQCFFWYNASQYVTIVQRRWWTRFGKDASRKNSIKDLERTVAPAWRGEDRGVHETVTRMWKDFKKSSPRKSICSLSQHLDNTTVVHVLLKNYNRPLISWICIFLQL